MANTKAVIAFVLALVITAAIYGAYQYPSQFAAIGSAAGTSFNTAKIAEESVVVGTTTTFAIQNTDASDRTIRGAEVMLYGATGTSTTYTVNCATSSTASALGGNTNYILATSLATSTFGSIVSAGTFVSTTSPGITGTTTASIFASLANPFARNWAAGSYLVCQVTTADGYNAFNAATKGFIAFPYIAQ